MLYIRHFFLSACFLATALFSGLGDNPAAAREPSLQLQPGAVLAPADDAFLDELERASFRFFDEQTNVNTGLVADRSSADGSAPSGKASIASSGFALAGWAIATEHGWVSRETAVVRVRHMLRFLAERAPTQHGFYYHFMEMDTGARAWDCEVSTIDTSLLLAGAIVAREYFDDPEITNLVNYIYARIDWPWFLNGGETLSMGWDDEHGFSRYRWESYSEHMVMSILGMGSPTKPLPADYWTRWTRNVSTYGGQTYIHGAPPLFIHQFSHAYIDFRNQRDAYADYWRNSVLATLAQRQFCIDMRGTFPTWGERLWGITASDSEQGYIAWGGPLPAFEGSNLDGTLVPCASAGSLPFTPNESLTTLRHMREAYSSRVWKRYGFVDSFNPESKWTSTDVIGIDVGITLLQAENARTGLVWALFMQAPEIQRALDRAGFASTERDLPATSRLQLRRLAASTWLAVATDPTTPGTLGLRITATIAAHALGLIPSDEALTRLRDLVEKTPMPPDTDDVALSQYAAALITLRQAFPQLATEATRRLDAINWQQVTPQSNDIGSASRLSYFFKIATTQNDYQQLLGALQHTVTTIDNVRVLKPADEADAFVPSLWLDERQHLTGASASQLAYARLMAQRAAQNATASAALAPLTPMAAALQIEYFPTEILPLLTNINLTTPDAVEAEADAGNTREAAGRATLLVSLANVIAGDCIRNWFSQDPFVQQASMRVLGAAKPSFGRNNSVFTYRELSNEPAAPAPLATRAHRADSSPAGWDWQTVAGIQFKDSVADVYPDDPELKLRFAFTWDDAALHFHAEATDTPPGYKKPKDRNEMVELFLNPKGDGFQWNNPTDHQFTFTSDGHTLGFSPQTKSTVRVKRTDTGYTIDATIPWAEIGIAPAAGMRLGATASIYAGGPLASQPSLKLNWSYHPLADGRAQLGIVTLEK